MAVGCHCKGMWKGHVVEEGCHGQGDARVKGCCRQGHRLGRTAPWKGDAVSRGMPETWELLWAGDTSSKRCCGQGDTMDMWAEGMEWHWQGLY